MDIARAIEKSKEIRKNTIKYRIDTNSAHIGSDLSCVEIISALYYEVMEPNDTFLLSKGHGSGALYTVLLDLGKIPKAVYHKLSHHPDINPEYGIFATTGSLGHGLSLGAGMAFSDKTANTYVLLGDGECDEGQVWEAADFARRLKIGNLIGIIDCNGWQGYKASEYQTLEGKFKAFNWITRTCDGHDIGSIVNTIKIERDRNVPLAILAKTIKGKGLEGGMEGTLDSHYKIPKN